MRLRTSSAWLFSLGLLGVAPSALPQEQTAALEGVVRDQQGGVLPGATVEARSRTVGSVLRVVTQADGAYRIPAVLPGEYDLTATLDGFRPAAFERVEALLGQIKRVDFALKLGGITETVEVSAVSPLIDVRQSARSSSRTSR